jgi:hypothetical protein
MIINYLVLISEGWRHTVARSRQEPPNPRAGALPAENLLETPDCFDSREIGWNGEPGHRRRPYPVFLESINADCLDQVADSVAQERFIGGVAEVWREAFAGAVVDAERIGQSIDVRDRHPEQDVAALRVLRGDKAFQVGLLLRIDIERAVALLQFVLDDDGGWCNPLPNQTDSPIHSLIKRLYTIPRGA